MNKRGMSVIVATILIILVTIAIIAVVLFAVVFVGNDLGGAGVPMMNLAIISDEGYTVWDSESRLASVQIERTGEGEILGFNLVFVIGGKHVTHFVDDIPGVNSRRVYYLNLSDCVGDLEAINVAPVFVDGVVGDVTSELKFGNIRRGDLKKLIDEEIVDASMFVSPNGGSGGRGGLVILRRFVGERIVMNGIFHTAVVKGMFVGMEVVLILYLFQ